MLTAYQIGTPFQALKIKKKARCTKTKKSIFDLYNEQNPPKETSTDTKTVVRVEDETKTVTKEETKTEETKTEEVKTEETKTEEVKTEETKTEETKGGGEDVV